MGGAWTTCRSPNACSRPPPASGNDLVAAPLERRSFDEPKASFGASQDKLASLILRIVGRVMTMVLALSVEGPVIVEVASPDQSPELEGRLGPVQASASFRDVETVADERAIFACDDAYRDGRAYLQTHTARHSTLPFQEVIQGFVDGFALRDRQTSSGRAMPHSGRDIAGMALNEPFKSLQNPLFELGRAFRAQLIPAAQRHCSPWMASRIIVSSTPRSRASRRMFASSLGSPSISTSYSGPRTRCARDRGVRAESRSRRMTQPCW